MEPEKHHVHHSYMWLGSLRIVAVILFATAISMGSSLIGVLADTSGEDMFVTLMVFAVCGVFVLLVIIVAVVAQVISYKHLWYEIGPAEFSFYQGIFSKKRVHIPYQRIQSVDQRASLLQRIFGVCTVSIDTAGGSANKATIVPYLTKQDAELLRRELFARKRFALAVEAGEASEEDRARFAEMAWANASVAEGNVLDAPANLWDDIGGVFAGESIDTGRVSFEYGLTNKELILTGLSNNTAFALVLVGVLGVVGQVLEGALSFAPGAVDAVGHAVVQGPMWVAGGAAVLVFGVVLLIWGLSAVATCISFGGFKARRRGNRIEVERGLLQHQFSGVDVDRVQSVTVRQSLVRRLLGCCEISLGKVEAVSGEDGSNRGVQTGGLVIHPFVKMSRVPEILAGIIPEYADVPFEAQPLPRVALRRGIIRRCILQGFGFWLGVFTAACHIALSVAASLSGDPDIAEVMPYATALAIAGYVFAVALIAVDAVGAVLWFRESSFAYNQRFMQITLGGLARESTSFLRGKIQFGYTRVNPFQRRAGTRTIFVRTAAGVGGSTMRLIDVSELDALAWLDWLKPRGNVRL